MSARVPTAVYWRRRLVVLTIAAVLFAAISHVLSRGTDAGAGRVTAVETAASPRPTPATHPSAHPPVHPASHHPTPTPTPTPLPQPDGSCQDSDVSVVPQVPVALAGTDVALMLVLRTLTSPACIWQVSSSHLALKVSRGSQEIWSTRQCPGAISAQQVVLRRDTATHIVVTWGSRHSDAGCTDRTEWARPGDYDLLAAALGGEPARTSFTLTVPTPTPTPTPTAHPSGSAWPSAHPSTHPSGHSTPTPTAHPSAQSHEAVPQT